MASCAHLEAVTITELPDTIAGCEDCLAAGGVWCHLRICLSCGHVGCCDSSPGRHASAHAAATGHPLDPLGAAGRGLVVVLRRQRHAAHPRRDRRAEHPAVADGLLVLRLVTDARNPGMPAPAGKDAGPKVCLWHIERPRTQPDGDRRPEFRADCYETEHW